MRFQERQYTIDPSIMKDEGTTVLAKRAKESIDLWMVDTEGLVEDFMRSERFRALSEAEQIMAVRAVKACVDGSEWALGAELDESGLFSVTVPVERIQTVEQDVEVLSGAFGSLVEDFYADEVGESIWKETGHGGNMSDLRLLGALVNEGGSPTGAGAGFELKKAEQKKTMIYVGADLHGDFGMWQVDSSHNSAYSPGGTKETFSPVEIKAVRAYHSVEIEMVGDLLSHLADGKDGNEIVSRIEAILGMIEQRTPDVGGSHAFGDYGSSDRKVKDVALDWRDYRGHNNFKVGEAIGSYSVTPGRFGERLQIVSQKDGVIFRQVEDEGKLSQIVASEIHIPDANIADLIAAITVSDQGRVAPAEIIELLNRIRSHASGDTVH